MNEPLDHLLQRLLDHDLTAEERRLLEARLEADPSARARQQELSKVFDALRSARLDAAPAGMRDDVLEAIRGAAPSKVQAPARAGRPSFPWLRLALPLAGATVAALLLTANWQGAPWRVGGEWVAGTLSPRAMDSLRLGHGAASVQVRWHPTASGFELRIQTKDAPVHVALEALTEGTRLSLAPEGSPTFSPRIAAALPANAIVIAEGTAPDTGATIRVSVTFPDGRSAEGQLRLRGLPAPR